MDLARDGTAIHLGDQIRDCVTGLEGIASGKCVYVNGCVQYEITPRRKDDGDKVEGRWVDVGQIDRLAVNPLGLCGRPEGVGAPDWENDEDAPPAPIQAGAARGGPQSTPSGLPHP